MSYYLLLHKYLFYFLVWCFRIAYYMGIHTPKKIETFIDADNKYIEPLKKKFANIFESSLDVNRNVHPIFYNKKEYNEYMQNTTTELEQEWRTRMLLEYTPRGNVLMFYDAFKMGFSFYSDEKTISYDILNAVAMKYVTMFRCLDFFIDESVVPKEKYSPFIKLYFTEEPKKVEENKSTASIAPFAKMRRENPNAKGHVNTKEKTDGTKELLKNKFLYLGKMNNSLFLQPAPKVRKVLSKFTSPLLETIKLESGVQRERISYKDFKKSIKFTENQEPTYTVEGQIAI